MRVVDSDVKAIRPSVVDALPFILAASAVIDAHISTAGWSLLLATELERWLAAHLMEMASPSVTRKRLADTDLSRATSTLGAGLQATRFGQTVLALDTSGTLGGQVGMKRAIVQTV